MWTKKIEIKDENHLKEVVKVLESIGERMWGIYQEYPPIKSFWYENNDNCWYSDTNSIDKFKSDKDVPEYEIITKTSYELKEVPKIKITCESCGKTIEYKVTERLFKDFVIFKGMIDFGDTNLSSQNFNHICKDCMKKLINI